MSNKKKSIRLFIQFFLIFTSLHANIAFALIYNCPKLPIKAKIGEAVAGEWYLGYEWGERPGVIKKYYYKYFGKEYTFDKWFTLKGVNYSEGKSAKIMCCDSFENGSNMLCISRDIESGKCESLLFDEEINAFKCEKT